MYHIKLECQCGRVQGMGRDIAPTDGTRVKCYCRDCQAFAHYLNSTQAILDEYGGTDIYQLAPARLSFSQGQDLIRCVRLTNKGLFRWYASCCNTPIANTVSGKVPFVGLIHNIIADEPIAGEPLTTQEKLGPVQAHVNTASATSPLPANIIQQAHARRYTMKILIRILWWKLSGKGKPSPFFDASGAPISRPHRVNE